MSAWVIFAEIKRRIPLAQVLRRYQVGGLRRSGIDQYRGRCPIHRGQGKEAFHVNLQRGVFHCFACGAGGNVLDFVAAMEGCSIRDAALRLQGSYPIIAGMRAPANGSAKRELVTKKRSVNPALGFSLTLDSRHNYLEHRGVDAATASYFGVGYFHGCGLMRGRIAIPIHDERGRLVAYSGRAVDGAEPRYRFPAGFQKSLVLFNYHRARAAPSDQVILVEGFFDCMRVHQAGYPWVAGLMGAQLSRTQKDLLANRFSTVLLLLDGDQAGRSATAQIASDLAPVCSVIPVHLAAGVQPDQLTADEIRRVLGGNERRQTIGAN